MHETGNGCDYKMIYFSDPTINETNGNFNSIVHIMRDQEMSFDWMLRSNATVVSTDILGNVVITSNYMLHFWSSGTIHITHTDRPLIIGAPDNDIKELKEWSVKNGWKSLRIDNRVVEDPQAFEFWMRMFISGLIECDALHRHEEAEMNRLTDLIHIERDQSE